MRGPDPGVCERHGQGVLGEPPDVGAFEGMSLQHPAEVAEVEHERVERDLGETEPEAVEHHHEPYRLGFDACLLPDLLDGDLDGRISDIRPSGRIEPDP